MNRLISALAIAAVAACGGKGGGNNPGNDGGGIDGGGDIDSGTGVDSGGIDGGGIDGGNIDGGGIDAAIDAGDTGGPLALVYTDPPGGALRLVKNAGATGTAMVLDLVVGDAPLTGYSTGFDLPLDTSKVTLGAFTPRSALDPGSAPRAAAAVIATQGPLRGMLVVGQSQKATGTGAVPTDTVLAPNTVLFSVELDLVQPRLGGVVFDGTASGVRLPSGGLRSKAGLTIVDSPQVKIGKLEVRSP